MKLDSLIWVSRLRSIQVLMGVLFVYLVLMSFEIPLVFRTGFGSDSTELESHFATSRAILLDSEKEAEPVFHHRRGISVSRFPTSDTPRKLGEYRKVSGLVFDENSFNSINRQDLTEIYAVVRDAFAAGKKLFEEIESGKVQSELDNRTQNLNESCPNSMILAGHEFVQNGRLMVIPCGLSLGSHVTVVGTSHWAHSEKDSKIAAGEETVMVSQFMMELQGLKTVDGEDPPRILHLNPRLKGDWSGRAVIEHNTCYRMQWGASMRCDGLRSKPDEETVDGQMKCEKWIRDDDNRSEESKTTWWLKRLIGRTKKEVSIDWPYPFAENKLFVLTVSAGLEGYHVHVDGRHVSSFPYRTGFTLEDATGLSVKGDLDVHSIFVASLPSTHPSFAPQRHLEMLPRWQAPPLPIGPVELFIGILSAGNHFAERMAVRKSWMQHGSIRSLNVVARFFVAMHGRKEINAELMKEANFFGDIVIVPYMDNYDLVVLKTVAICEYGVRAVASKYIMKCDDDTFVRIDAVMNEVKKVPHGRSLYVGNINYYHKPLRHGKWAVTYEEWPEEDYPPYANGPGYIISADIAQSIVSDFEQHKLRLFKMEDVSMGMWVERLNRTKGVVEYVHSLKFCQFGCIEGYTTAHYQSPKQMICLWDKLQQSPGKAHCCNVR